MKRILLIISMCSTVIAFGQQQPLFTQYFSNDMAINPAVSGSKTYNPLTLQTRKQWIGFEGAPFTSNISYHGALNNRSAMGGYLMFDKAFPSMQANLHLNYAYHIPLNYDMVNLSFGIGAKVMYHNIDLNNGDLPPGDDYAFSSNSYERVLSDASSGIYLYGKNFYAGFSVLNMLQSSFNTPITGSPYSNIQYRNYYSMAAYRFNIIDNDWQLEPSFLIRKIEFQPSITDLSARVFYLRDTWAGLTYRTNGTAIFGLGFSHNNIHIAYSYDYTLRGEIMQYNYGTHELTISYRLETMRTKRHIGFWGY